MKRYHFCMLMIALMLFEVACHGAPGHMSFKDDPSINVFNIVPEQGKAALVVARTINYAGPTEFETYLNKKMIGVTKWSTYFVKTDVAPGAHYIIALAEGRDVIKLNFEPGRVYYIQQIPAPGAFRAHVNLAPVTPQELSTSFDSGVKLVVYDNSGNDLSDSDFQKYAAEYEKEVREGRHKEAASYRGVLAK